MLQLTLSVMKNFILIEPTNVKIIYARHFLLTLCTAVMLAIKRIDESIKAFCQKFDLESSTTITEIWVLCVFLSAC